MINVVAESGAGSDGYLTPIGVDNNYFYQPFDGTTQTFVSMLIDPRAPVHATTAILPDASVAIPLNFASEAISKMNVTFRVNGLLTDQKLAMPSVVTMSLWWTVGGTSMIVLAAILAGYVL